MDSDEEEEEDEGPAVTPGDTGDGGDAPPPPQSGVAILVTVLWGRVTADCHPTEGVWGGQLVLEVGEGQLCVLPRPGGQWGHVCACAEARHIALYHGSVPEEVGEGLEVPGRGAAPPAVPHPAALGGARAPRGTHAPECWPSPWGAPCTPQQRQGVRGDGGPGGAMLRHRPDPRAALVQPAAGPAGRGGRAGFGVHGTHPPHPAAPAPLPLRPRLQAAAPPPARPGHRRDPQRHQHHRHRHRRLPAPAHGGRRRRLPHRPLARGQPRPAARLRLRLGRRLLGAAGHHLEGQRRGAEPALPAGVAAPGARPPARPHLPRQRRRHRPPPAAPRRPHGATHGQPHRQPHGRPHRRPHGRPCFISWGQPGPPHPPRPPHGHHQPAGPDGRPP
ncbi:uncharacterized protein [Ciconia boyciana]|uniref:uncharacterized protein isoform X2 n=1 Tax=Ciconia boyciana TaxID=52775 RepID=UPI003BA2420C